MFARNGHTVVMLDRNAGRCETINADHVNPDYLTDITLPHNITATTDPDEAFQNIDYIFHAIPIQVSESYLKQFIGKINNDTPIICMSKGIHNESLKFMNDIIMDIFGKDQKMAFLSGPSFAREIATDMPTGFTLASSSIELARQISELMVCDPFVRVWITDDVVGVEVGGALKNIYAIASGVLEGAGYGYNPAAMLVTSACQEMQRLAIKLGARKSTLNGLSGIGDLMLTCFGPASRNRSVGVRIGKVRQQLIIFDSPVDTTQCVTWCADVFSLFSIFRVNLWRISLLLCVKWQKVCLP